LEEGEKKRKIAGSVGKGGEGESKEMRQRESFNEPENEKRPVVAGEKLE
jgi:hypothetical protein